MPALSPTMSQGNIVSWNKKVRALPAAHRGCNAGLILQLMGKAHFVVAG
jgi:hypothetical protein